MFEIIIIFQNWKVMRGTI